MKIRLRSAVQLSLAQTVLALFLAFAQSAPAASCVTNSPMISARYNHTATLLPNGKVLVAGGWNDRYLSSAELYDPATGKWTATGAMTTGHSYHTATLLPNGKVLVAGGYANDSPFQLGGAELYDPTTGMWTNTGSMVGTHVYHSATLLLNGKVLVTGGTGANTELYEPASGTWTNTGSMNRARGYHAAALLTNGNVLVAGGDYNYVPLGFFSTAEVYNPTTGIWTSTSAMTTNRTSPTATLLPNGLVLVAGGWLLAQVQTNPPAYSSFSLTSGELFDPVTGNWTATTNTMAIGRNDHTASLLPNGLVLMAAGFQNGPGDCDSIELFDPVTSVWIPVTNKLNNARSHHTATILPSGGVLVTGGISPNGVSNSTEVYDTTINPATGTWTNTVSLTTPRRHHTATLLSNGKVLITGGESPISPYTLRSSVIYDLATRTWTMTGFLNIAREMHTATLLTNGKVLVAGGVGYTSGYLSSAELFDLATGTWSETGAMTTARELHTATLLPNGKVLVAGGLGSAVLSSAELYDPDAGAWTTTGAMTSVRVDHTATLLCNGKVLVAGGNPMGESSELYTPATGVWTATSPLAFYRALHTATLLPEGKVLVAGGFGNGGLLSSAELFDPDTETWVLTEAMANAREFHKSVLLLSGKVLVVGDSAELFDPAIGDWAVTDAPNTGRGYGHTATLLANGETLVVGGFNSINGNLSKAELFDLDPSLSHSSQPAIISLNTPLNLGTGLVITGSQFRGVSGASGGSTQDSSSDYPLVQLRSIESGQAMFLQTTKWSTNSFTSLPVWNFPPGWAMVTVFVNGIPSTSSIVNLTVPVPTSSTITNVTKLANGSIQFTFTNSVGAVFGALASTNLSLPFSNWTALGGITEVSPGQFQFTDPQATNSSQRFYRVRAN